MAPNAMRGPHDIWLWNCHGSLYFCLSPPTAHLFSPFLFLLLHSSSHTYTALSRWLANHHMSSAFHALGMSLGGGKPGRDCLFWLSLNMAWLCNKSPTMGYEQRNVCHFRLGLWGVVCFLCCLFPVPRAWFGVSGEVVLTFPALWKQWKALKKKSSCPFGF